MSQKWNQVTLQSKYIDAQAEEGPTLEYKRADSLAKTPGKKMEITKDVSAMANAAGGTIIYGIAEYSDDDRCHLPERLDPIDRTQYSKEWLDQVINSIQPRIPVLITPVPLAGGANQVAYVVEVPQGKTAHQAQDCRYYRRYNFLCQPMLDYEVRDVMGRLTVPDVQPEFRLSRVGRSGEYEDTWRIEIRLQNEGPLVVHNAKLRLRFPLEVKSKWVGLGGPDSLLFRVVDPSDTSHVIAELPGGVGEMVTRNQEVILPEDSMAVPCPIRCFLFNTRFDQEAAQLVKLDWRLWADTMPPKSGSEDIMALAERQPSVWYPASHASQLPEREEQ